LTRPTRLNILVVCIAITPWKIKVFQGGTIGYVLIPNVNTRSIIRKRRKKMKNKITYLDITIPGDRRSAYFGIHRGAKITTNGKRISPARMCLIASLAEELMFNAGMQAFSKDIHGTYGGHIHLTWFNKSWRQEPEDEEDSVPLDPSARGKA
jgi:hypothetical protein